MTPSNSMCEVPNYGSSASYCDLPSPEQIRAGVVPLDSLPAAWWNAMWACTNGEVNKARDMLGQLITELNSVLTQAGVCACSSCTDQLYQSIDKIRQTLANATTAGAVKSSSQPSEIAVDANGYMTVNCLGNAASLTTSASTVVGAINELKSTYDTCWSNNTTALSGKAPTSHASTATTYGVGNADNYGHLRISDTYASVLSTCSGVAASQKAVACVYAVAAAAAAGNVALGNTAGCALGTAAAGTSTTAARSDHVHPVPTSVNYAVTGGYLGERAALGCAPNCSYGIANIWNYCNDSRYYLIGTKYDNTACKYNVRVDYATSAGSAVCASCNGHGVPFGTAATCAVTAFRSCTWTPTCVCCSQFVCHTAYLVDADRPIMIASDDQTCTSGIFGTSQGTVRSGCNFTYNPATGMLKLKSNGKIACISHTNAGYLHIYTDAPGIAFNQDICIPNGKYICRAKYACCATYDGSGTAFGSAATCAATAFRSCTWWPNSTSCGCVCCAAKASDAVFATGACCSYNHRGYTFPFSGNCNQCIRGVCICCYSCCMGCVCFFNCTCAPKLITYAKFTSNGYSRDGFILHTCGCCRWAGECWAWDPSRNCFTIYEFSAT